MARTGPVIIIEDDSDEQHLLSEIFKELEVKNSLRFFPSAEGVIDYLLTTTDKPFLILSDVNLPGMSGTELRRKINENEQLRRKSIPFVFLTTSARKDAVAEAYDMMVQGYFEKPHTYKELKEILKVALDYWRLCKHPNTE